MAATAATLAKSVVGNVLSKAASAAAEEMSLLLGVQKEIWFIRDELQMMQAFLRAAERADQENNEVVKAWVTQVKDLAYDTEDCLEEFEVHVRRKSLSRQLMKLGARHRIAVQIRNLKARVEEVSQRNSRYNLIKPLPASSEDIASNVELARRLTPLYTEEKDLVGIDRQKDAVLQWIKDTDTGFRVISVVGMGGLGKTTLAKKVYDHGSISGLFQRRVWVTVSQSFHHKSLFMSVLRELVGHDALQKLLNEGKLSEVEQVAQRITSELTMKRYLVVFDDLWTKDAWDVIKPILPKNKNCSRVIVTTRDAGVARYLTSPSSLIHNLEPLGPDDSLDLLLRKISKLSHAELNNSKDLKDLIDRVLKKCGGLPLAIITIGGLINTRPRDKWQSFCDSLPSELETNPSLEAMRRVVTLSYNHLPYYLKPCLLYLSIFPEDFEIQRTYLVNRWIAEGFVKERAGATMEDDAEDYLYELIDRSMIQLSRSTARGKVGSVRIHDITRDVIVSISREENLVFLIEGHNTTASVGNIRHLSFLAGEYLLFASGVDLCRVRSLTIFDKPMESISLLCSVQLKMLRVLALENAKFFITQQDMRHISSLCHLRYLSVSNSFVYALPRSIGNLQSLQTLDISNTFITRLPTEVGKLRRLRNLHCGVRSKWFFDPCEPGSCLTNLIKWPIDLISGNLDREDCARRNAEIWATSTDPFSSTGLKVPKDIGSLKCLQTLDGVDIKRSGGRVIEEIGRLSQLHVLSVKGLTNKTWMKFCGVLHKLSSLRSLYVEKEGKKKRHSQSDHHFSPPPLLESLTFWGYLEKLPTWFTQLDKLCNISLTHTELMEGEHMEILKGSPNLVSLYFRNNAYSGRELVFQGQIFAKLQMIYVRYMKELEGIIFGEDVLPNLEKISIFSCKLQSGICGIKHLPKLKVILLGHGCKVRGLDMLEKELAEHPKKPRPVLQMHQDRSEHDLGPKADASRERTAVPNATAKVLERSLSWNPPTSSVQDPSFQVPTGSLRKCKSWNGIGPEVEAHREQKAAAAASSRPPAEGSRSLPAVDVEKKMSDPAASTSGASRPSNPTTFSQEDPLLYVPPLTQSLTRVQHIA